MKTTLLELDNFFPVIYQHKINYWREHQVISIYAQVEHAEDNFLRLCE
jgi:hypothetical protein